MGNCTSFINKSGSDYFDATAQNESGNLTELARLPREFRFKDLKEATNNFQDKLGSGGSGSVFKGILGDGTPIAVKRIDRAIYGEWEYKSEICAIASVQHVHLIRLRGYCSHMKRNKKKTLFIVYDLLPKGSLDSLIFRKGGEIGPCLSWKARCRVAVDVAKALAYLHHDCHRQILHLDIKPANILLDDNFRAVVSDFGLSQLMKEDETRFHTLITRGSGGYMAPEWLTNFGISEKSDIYSYGKVLLDLFFGQQQVCLDKNGKDIYTAGGNTPLEYRTSYSFIEEKLKREKLLDLIDTRLMEEDKVSETEARCLILTALMCLEEDPKRRPGDMRQVVKMLQGLTGSRIERHLIYLTNSLAQNVNIQNNIPLRLLEQHIETPNKYKEPKEDPRLPQEFSYKDLKVATNNFKDFLGRGSISPVFKGILEDGTLVAVKKVKGNWEKNFKKEFAAVASVQHINLVRLCGYCVYKIKTGNKLFFTIFDYLPKGSLDNWIFADRAGMSAPCLSWKLRCRVAVEVAMALSYLHHDCHTMILHLDIEPQNILLSENFRAHLSNFGLSKLMEEEGHSTGTYGYMAPERMAHGAISAKCDIYSYGHVLLDMFSGESIKDWHHRTRINHEIDRRAYFLEKFTEMKILDLIDKRLMKDVEVDEIDAKTLINVALKCLEVDPAKRPVNMGDVVDMLQFKSLNSAG